MGKTLNKTLLLIMTLLSILLIISGSTIVSATTYEVYTASELRNAIENSQPGDVIIIHGGIYDLGTRYDSFTFPTDLDIDDEGVVLKAAGDGVPLIKNANFRVKADNVVITGLSFSSSGFSVSLSIYDCSEVVVENNTFTHASLILDGARSFTIRNNAFENSEGIKISETYYQDVDDVGSILASNNSLNGLPILLIGGRNGEDVLASNIGQLIVMFSSNINVRDAHIATDIRYPVWVFKSRNISLLGISADENIRVEDFMQIKYSENVEIKNARLILDDSSWTWIKIYNSENIAVKESTMMHKEHGHGIVVYDTRNLVIEGNVIINASYDIIDLTRVEDAVIRDNHIETYDTSAIYVSEGTDVSIEYNTITTSVCIPPREQTSFSDFFIEILDSEGNVNIVDNNLEPIICGDEDVNSNGIRVRVSEQVEISIINNDLANFVEAFYIEIYEENAAITIRNNNVSNVSSGMLIANGYEGHEGSYVTVAYNRFEDVEEGAIKLSNYGELRIYLNVFANIGSKPIDILGGNVSSEMLLSPEPLAYIYNEREFFSKLGNYYDDYEGVDADNDGVGDEPYPIDPSLDVYDVKPLISEEIICSIVGSNAPSETTEEKEKHGMEETMIYHVVNIEDIKKVLSEEKNVSAKLLNVTETFSKLMEGNLTDHEEMRALNILKETYDNLRSKGFIKTEISKMPSGVIATLRQIYGNGLEKYPTISGRVQLLYTILMQVQD